MAAIRVRHGHGDRVGDRLIDAGRGETGHAASTNCAVRSEPNRLGGDADGSDRSATPAAFTFVPDTASPARGRCRRVRPVDYVGGGGGECGYGRADRTAQIRAGDRVHDRMRACGDVRRFSKVRVAI